MRIAILPLLVAALYVGYAAARVHQTDSLVGPRNDEETRSAVARSLLETTNPERFDPKRPPTEAALAVAKLIPNMQDIRSFATVLVPSPQKGSWRPVTETEEVPYGARLVVTKPVVAREMVLRQIKQRIAQLKQADAIYPHMAEVAFALVSWHLLLSDFSTDTRERKLLTVEALKWAEETVRRGPEQAWCRQCYARALWLRGSVETGPAQLDYYRKSLEQYRQTTVLYPTEPKLWDSYGKQQMIFGEALREAGGRANNEAVKREGAEWLQRGRDALRRAEEITQQKTALQANTGIRQ